jgi:ADP-ribose pyrophosphatase YjhB (NUDIX family)
VRAYGVAIRGGHVLLVRATQRDELPRIWWLPGGGIDLGETPEEALAREVEEETGLTCLKENLLTVVSDVRTRPSGEIVHFIRIVYSIEVAEGELRHETGGSSDLARWVPLAELPHLNVADYARRAIKEAQTK